MSGSVTSGDVAAASSSEVPVRLGRAGDAVVEAGSFPTACAAPSIQLRFDPNGLVTTCCKSLQPLGHIGHERLPEIWHGAVRARVEAAVSIGDFSEGCQRCGAEIAQEGRAASYAAIHDQWAGHLTADPASRAWPVRMEFNLSNACNLQCIQCDGDSSSSIRTHREHRPPLPTVYTDQFFDDLAEFLPHLDRIVFAGGEPFLGAENFRVWDMIAETAAPVDCVVVTNATQWTPRIEALLERIPFSFIFSIDGITKSTYESIRVGADFDRVMANVERFCRYVVDRGTVASVNHCLMPSNAHEFGGLLMWAEERGLFVNVSVVRTPAHASIARLDPAEIRRISDVLEAQDARVRAQLTTNLSTWDTERERIAAWASAGARQGDAATHSVLFFRCAGSGPYDDTAVRAELAEWSPDGRIESVSVGPDDIIRSCEVSVTDESTLVGRTIHEFTKALVLRHGELNDYRVTSTSDDVVWAEARFGEVRARIVTVALRDQEGWADRATVSVAFRHCV